MMRFITMKSFYTSTTILVITLVTQTFAMKETTTDFADLINWAKRVNSGKPTTRLPRTRRTRHGKVKSVATVPTRKITADFEQEPELIQKGEEFKIQLRQSPRNDDPAVTGLPEKKAHYNETVTVYDYTTNDRLEQKMKQLEIPQIIPDIPETRKLPNDGDSEFEVISKSDLGESLETCCPSPRDDRIAKVPELGNFAQDILDINLGAHTEETEPVHQKTPETESVPSSKKTRMVSEVHHPVDPEPTDNVLKHGEESILVLEPKLVAQGQDEIVPRGSQTANNETENEKPNDGKNIKPKTVHKPRPKKKLKRDDWVTFTFTPTVHHEKATPKPRMLYGKVVAIYKSGKIGIQLTPHVRSTILLPKQTRHTKSKPYDLCIRKSDIIKSHENREKARQASGSNARGGPARAKRRPRRAKKAKRRGTKAKN